MSGDPFVKAYHHLPHSLKVISTSAVAFYKKQKKYGKFFESYYNYLVSSNSNHQEEKAQEELGEFLKYVKRNCRFYSKFISEKSDINQLPIIDKETVNKHYSEFLLEKPFFTGKSSGTTGQPLKVPYSQNVYQKEYAFWWYHRSLRGVFRGDKIATFAGHKIADVNRDNPPFWVFNAAENQMFFSSYHLSIKNLLSYIIALNRYSPDFLHGYPSSLFLVAKYILEEGINLDFQPKMIVTASETTLDFQRKAIEKAFNCKVYIWYGNTEFCGHVTECAYGKLHIQQYHSFVRVLREDNTEAKPGETGRIVATNFSNYSLALINYDIKDSVKISSDQNCPCNKGGIILDYVFGRVEDYIITPEGRFVGRLDHLFKDAQYVRNGQIIQNSFDSVIIRIERENCFTNKVENAIRKEAINRLGKTIDIQFEYVKEIEKEPNGKFKFIIQNTNGEVQNMIKIDRLSR